MVRGLTRRRSWRGPASARRPSRLVQRNLHGVTPSASRTSHASSPRAALPWPRGPWPCSLTSDPLGRPRLSRPHLFPRPPGQLTNYLLEGQSWALGQRAPRYCGLTVVSSNVYCAGIPLAAPRGERSGATTLPLRPPCQFTHSPLHIRPPPAVGECVNWQSPSRDGRGAASLTRHPPERVRRTCESASRQLRCILIAFPRCSRATVAPLLRRFASARSHLRRRSSHPSILQERCPWRARSCRCVSTAVAPIADRESLLRTRRGNWRAGHPD